MEIWEVSRSTTFFIKISCIGPGGLDSGEFRLYKAQEKVAEIGSKMGLHRDLIEAGKRIYKLAFNKNFIQGRTVSVVAAVCLYAACRVD